MTRPSFFSPAHETTQLYHWRCRHIHTGRSEAGRLTCVALLGKATQLTPPVPAFGQWYTAVAGGVFTFKKATITLVDLNNARKPPPPPPPPVRRSSKQQGPTCICITCTNKTLEAKKRRIIVTNRSRIKYHEKRIVQLLSFPHSHFLHTIFEDTP